ncbi:MULTISPECIES: DUF6457 domain-containing protein [unclassified Solwaraspora]|uniref:DUF6457 domain-containing protein n=1 Tax=unclassified Solwaraspora TaxID=2627926 RepID=UPI00248C773D|nr:MULTISPECIES: DUF6457 domain-containing protein [unclassified Solwaraspora]WBC00470.1 DUF6457 domain-containing protein [Solwaraspora sp. WMMA2059]WBC23921.1 DUF6457 domain-containing protein [Solwaraspora sp. WMMA2080]WJK37860.1 DUF6457 domain-containing protein [Solwaraspora sp. WMMA2065]
MSDTMTSWVASAAAELGLDPGEVPVPVVLDLARDVAHNVLRPGAPVTAYLLGLAVGRGADPVEAGARLAALARAYGDGEEVGPAPGEVRPAPGG